MNIDGTLDEAYERLHRTGPEFEGWLSNHGPMAVESMNPPSLATTRITRRPASRWQLSSARSSAALAMSRGCAIRPSGKLAACCFSC